MATIRWSSGMRAMSALSSVVLPLAVPPLTRILRRVCNTRSSLPSRLEPQPRGVVTRRAVAQRRSRAGGLTRPLAAAIRGFGLGFVVVPFPPFRCDMV